MAEAMLFGIAESLLMNLGSRALDGIASAWGFKGDLEKLKNTINTIKAVLLDAEERQLQGHTVNLWLERLKVAVYKADDLFDELATRVLQRKHPGGNKIAKEVKTFFSDSNQISLAFSISRKIKRIREELDGIVPDSNEFGFVLQPAEGRGVVVPRWRHETYSFVYAEEVIGRDDDKKAILDKILDPITQDQNVCVVPIVGIGGMGKTTLSQLVYNDAQIEKHFDLKLWVCVSESSDIKEIVKKILMSATNAVPQDLEMEQLQGQLRRQIEGKKYLLVMDDVWNENCEQWLEMRALLKTGREGSTILVTTRSWEVARIMGTIPPYALEGLSEEKTWNLFETMAFDPEQKHKNLQLLKIGKDIVKKCANVPLAVRTLGSLLYGKGESEWLYFKDRSLAHTSNNGNDIMTILKLSYHNLPPPLRNCFAYCAVFPKGCELPKEPLIWLWVAQGFVIPADETQCVEDTGEGYFLALLKRCFFQDITKDEWGNIRSCKMHDLMHDLAQKVAGVECKVAKLGEMDFDKRIYHLSLGYRLSSSCQIPNSVLDLKFLRTFILPYQIKDGSFFSNSLAQQLLSNFRCLRVLDLHGLELRTLPSSIGKLVHLRCLTLSWTPIRALPESITELQNLQTLGFYACTKLRKLPTNIRKLTNLRSLNAGQCRSLTYMPPGVGVLTSLHRLTFFCVNNNHSPPSRHKPGTAQLRELKNLNNLRGELHIKIIGELKDHSYEAKEANLSTKHGLVDLYLEGDSSLYGEVNGSKYDEALLEALKPHPNLKKLKIEFYRGQKLPNWAVMDNLHHSLPNLVQINLWRCKRCQQLPAFGQLPFLKRLSLMFLESVEYMEAGLHELTLPPEETLFFPSLQELTLSYMYNLKGWWKVVEEVVSDDQKDFPAQLDKRQHLSRKSFSNLSRLCVQYCHQLKSMPLCPNVEDLTLVGVNKNLVVLEMAANSTISTVSPAASSPSGGSSSKVKELCVRNVEDLISLSNGYLHHLSTLHVQDPELLCTSSLEEVLRSLPSLRCLYFSYCRSLRSISRGLEHLTALERLSLGGCSELDLLADDSVEDGMPWKALNSLRSLHLGSIPKLVALPSGLQQLTNLRSLDMAHLENLKELPRWINRFSFLDFMRLENCRALTSLPEGFQNLTSLDQLEILSSPKLAKRCQGPNGEDWPKIQHIPLVTVAEMPRDVYTAEEYYNLR